MARTRTARRSSGTASGSSRARASRAARISRCVGAEVSTGSLSLSLSRCFGSVSLFLCLQVVVVFGQVGLRRPDRT